MISWSIYLCCFGSDQVLLPGWAFLVPCLVRSVARSAFPGGIPVYLRWALPEIVFQRAVAAYLRCLALRFYLHSLKRTKPWDDS